MTAHLSDAAKLKIEYVAIEKLIRYANNARKHPKSQIRKLARSMEHFGFTNPLLVDGEYNVLAGHGRLDAAELNGVREVPVIALHHLSEADRKAYILADNKIALEAEWSKSMVKAELSGLADLGYEVELTGFSTLEIDTLIAMDDEEPIDDEVELPDQDATPVSRVGDTWEIGDHRLHVGDARLKDAFRALLGEERAEIVVTDPPYGCVIVNNVSGGGRKKHDNFVMGAGETSLKEFADTILRPAFQNIAAFSQPAAIAFVFTDWRAAPYFYETAKGIFHEVKNLIVWAKTNGAQGAFYRSAHELIYAFKVSAGKHINNFGLSGRYRTNIWTYAGANTFRKGRMEDLADHPTVKPKKLIADAILDCSRRGGIVLDPFLGSGTTLVAAAMTGRKGRGIELDPKYADVALRRIQAETGEIATLDGKPFDDVAAERRVKKGEN